MNRRVVVTGVGLVSPVGIGTKNVFEALLDGKNGIRRISKFDPEGYASQVAGEVDFPLEDYLDRKEARKMAPFIHFAVAASDIALKDSGLTISPENAAKVGVILGSGIGGLDYIEEQHKMLLEKGPRRVSPFFIPASIINLASGTVSIRTGAKGPNHAVVTACATGTHAIGDAFHMIQRGDADAMIAGGTESAVTPMAVAGFSSMKALSTRNDDPAHASRPFDAERDGFVIGEGAGIMILEELGSALKRGARIYGEVVGYGLTGDAYHMTAPAEDGDGPMRAMQMALGDITPDQVGYINAHGTSTPYNDKIESKAIRGVFGAHADKLMVSSTKSMVGHLLGAAGGLEGAVTVLSLFEGKVHPTANLTVPDPECDLDYITEGARALDAEYAMSNSFGFGGTNGCLLFKRFEN